MAGIVSVRCRPGTFDARRHAVERVILAMSERLDRAWSLDEFARIAISSPFHFNRIFRQITGISPFQFLAALRLKKAEQLLITTKQKVIDICFSVGYNSLGSFTRRFTELVGLPPLRLRRLTREFGTDFPRSLLTSDADRSPGEPGLHVQGRVWCDRPVQEPIFVGLFPTPIPQGRPVACSFLPHTGIFRIGPLKEGRYYLYSAQIPFDRSDPLRALVDDGLVLRAGGDAALVVAEGRSEALSVLFLRPARLTDPPILVSLPLLLSRHLVRSAPPEQPEAEIEEVVNTK